MRFSANPDSAGYTPTKFEAVTPSDADDFAYVCQYIYVGVAGNVAAVAHDGTVVTFTAVPAGSFIPGFFKRVNATNTTATNMVALG